MKLRIVEKDDGWFEVQTYNSILNEWNPDVMIGQLYLSRFRTYYEAFMCIENLKDIKENGEKINSIKQIYKEFEI